MAAALPFVPVPRCERDRLWEHAKNALGIARLLVQDGRPAALVDTACRMAEEAACRAALDQAGLRFDGDVDSALARLAAPRDLTSGRSQENRVTDCERVVGWIASYLRSEAPDRSWGY